MALGTGRDVCVSCQPDTLMDNVCGGTVLQVIYVASAALGLGDPMVARPPLPGSRMLSAGLLVVVATLAVVRWRRWLVQTVLSLAPPASHQGHQDHIC